MPCRLTASGAAAKFGSSPALRGGAGLNDLDQVARKNEELGRLLGFHRDPAVTRGIPEGAERARKQMGDRLTLGKLRRLVAQRTILRVERRPHELHSVEVLLNVRRGLPDSHLDLSEGTADGSLIVARKERGFGDAQNRRVDEVAGQCASAGECRDIRTASHLSRLP